MTLSRMYERRSAWGNLRAHTYLSPKRLLDLCVDVRPYGYGHLDRHRKAIPDWCGQTTCIHTAVDVYLD